MAIGTARRLEQIEAALTPTQVVLRWLAEAHAHGSLEAYVAWLLDQPPEDYPLDRLAREAVAGPRSGSRWRAREAKDDAARRALQDAVFRFELVMRINVTAHELLDREVLVQTVIAGHLALLANEPANERTNSSHRERLAASRDLAVHRVIELHAAEEARAIAEGRYLEGQPALFPDGLRAWAEQVHATERLAVMADRLAEVDGLAGPGPDDTAAARVLAVLADLVEPAKAAALEKLGEGGRAIQIATRWLRARAETPVER